MHVPKVSANKAYKKNCVPEFPILLALKYYLHVYFTGMNMYILTEGRNFKTLLKENYAIALDSCYLLTYYKYV